MPGRGDLLHLATPREIVIEGIVFELFEFDGLSWLQGLHEDGFTGKQLEMLRTRYLVRGLGTEFYAVVWLDPRWVRELGSGVEPRAKAAVSHIRGVCQRECRALFEALLRAHRIFEDNHRPPREEARAG